MISLEQLKLESSILHAGKLYQILAYVDKLPLKGCGQSHVTSF